MTRNADIGLFTEPSKNGNDERVFDALEWLAGLCSHVPNRSEQLVRDYGYYSNASRGKRRKRESAAISHVDKALKV